MQRAPYKGGVRTRPTTERPQGVFLKEEEASFPRTLPCVLPKEARDQGRRASLETRWRGLLLSPVSAVQGMPSWEHTWAVSVAGDI